MAAKSLPRGAKIALWALLCSMTLAAPACACLNSFLDGLPKRSPPPPDPAAFMAQLRDHPEHDRLASGPPPTDPGSSDDYKTWNDYAVKLVHRGESRRAVGILESVERGKPGEYIVAANLGTAYELSGELEKAHQWILEGIRRNPQSHQGTEWLHLRILEARMAFAKDPEWLQQNSVSGLDFGGDARPRMPRQWPQGAGDPEGVITALIYQLRERLAFVPAPDPIVASLIAELGAMLLLFRTAELALPVFELALAYRPAGEPQVTARKLLAEEMAQRHDWFGGQFILAALGLVGLAVGAALFSKWRQAR